LGFGFKVEHLSVAGHGHRVDSLVHRGLDCLKVWGLESKVWGLRFRGKGLGFRV